MSYFPFLNTIRRLSNIPKPNPKRQALLISSSNCHPYPMLDHAKQEVCEFLERNNVKELTFIPYARFSFDKYTKITADAIEPWGIKLRAIHTYSDPTSAINSSKAIFIGGGNAYLLLARLIENNLVSLINKKFNAGELLYIGSSAGTHVATHSVNLANNKPIIHPPTFNGIGIVPFNINAHFKDVATDPTRKGARTRIKEISDYLRMPHSVPVLGLREGAILHLEGESLIVKGIEGAVLFTRDEEMKRTEYHVGSDISFLLKHK